MNIPLEHKSFYIYKMKKLYKSSNIRVIVQKMRIKDIFDILLLQNGFTNLVNLVLGDYKIDLGRCF